MKRALALSLFLFACGTNATPGSSVIAANSDTLRSITPTEAVADFDAITNSFRSLYGAMQRKEQKYGFDFNSMVVAYRTQVANAKSEAEIYGLFQEFLARFEDAHISLYLPLNASSSHAYYLPFDIMPSGDTYVVYDSISPDVLVGDEVLSVDGSTPADLVTQYSKYVGMPNSLSKAHFAAMYITYRDVFLSLGLTPTSVSQLSVRGADGNVRNVAVPWTQIPSRLPESSTPTPQVGTSTAKTLRAYSPGTSIVTHAELTRFGDRTPIFFTPQSLGSLGQVTQVSLTPQSLVQFNLTAEQAVAINYYAIEYTTGGKSVLFVRLPDYDPADPDSALNYLRALFTQERVNADVLIVDETHNPGGSIDFAAGVAQLLAKSTFNAFVEEVHADRMWIDDYTSGAEQLGEGTPFGAALLSDAQLIETAYDANQTLSPPIPLFAQVPTLDPDPAHWTGPVVMITDELSVSCADFVPLLFKANHMGTLFGQTTMGGGGNVEQVATLPNTEGQLSISRGLGTVYDPTGAYPDQWFVEDNGVTPDVVVSHTIDDFRAGYVSYVAAFNAVAAAMPLACSTVADCPTSMVCPTDTHVCAAVPPPGN